MSLGEVLLIFVVALLVLGPGKLPILMRHMVRLWKKLEDWRFQWNFFWQEQEKQQTLIENSSRAEIGDEQYHSMEQMEQKKE